MRIVGGRLRGRALVAPKSNVTKSRAIRPTADRLRESLFNILAHAYGDPVTGSDFRISCFAVKLTCSPVCQDCFVCPYYLCTSRILADGSYAGSFFVCKQVYDVKIFQ